MQSLIRYHSVNKFVENISEKLSEQIQMAYVYFENSDTFINQFDKTCIKPVFILLKCKNKNIYLSHKKMLLLFIGQIYISLSDKNAQKLPEDKSKMCELVINFEKQEFNNIQYHQTDLIECPNEKNVSNIRKQIVKDFVMEEKEIPMDALK